MSDRTRMVVGLMLPIGMGALGDGRGVPWAVLRDMATLAEDVGVDPPGVRGVERFARVLKAFRD
jgi:hypothetical protein